MQALLLPKWVTKQITKIMRRFLWRGTKDTYLGAGDIVSSLGKD
jgi:hypothetical protein